MRQVLDPRLFEKRGRGGRRLRWGHLHAPLPVREVSTPTFLIRPPIPPCNWRTPSLKPQPFPPTLSLLFPRPLVFFLQCSRRGGPGWCGGGVLKHKGVEGKGPLPTSVGTRLFSMITEGTAQCQTGRSQRNFLQVRGTLKGVFFQDGPRQFLRRCLGARQK